MPDALHGKQPFSFTAAVPIADGTILGELKHRGISETSPQKVLAELPTDFAVLDTPFNGVTNKSVSNPPNSSTHRDYFDLLCDRVGPLATFETSRRQRLRREVELAQVEARRHLKTEQAYDEYVRTQSTTTSKST
jgi:hypothetical protein